MVAQRARLHVAANLSGFCPGNAVQVADQLVALQGTVDGADTAPTASCLTVFDELNARLETQLAAWRDIQSKDLADLNALIQKNNIPAIAPAAEKA